MYDNFTAAVMKILEEQENQLWELLYATADKLDLATYPDLKAARFVPKPEGGFVVYKRDPMQLEAISWAPLKATPAMLHRENIERGVQEIVSAFDATCASFQAGALAFDDSWEECTAAELVEDDVVTHILVGKIWKQTHQMNGVPSAGFKVTYSDEHSVYGYVLYEDGSTPAAQSCLFSLDNPCRLKVKPWDNAPAKVDVSRWNGTCVKCGKGVYQGFTSLDHDGPCR